LPYQERVTLIQSVGVALWDTLQACTRPGSFAAIGMLWAKLQGKRQFRGFERFWRRELDIEDAEAIAAVLSEVHADRTGFRGS
jgi:hypothetical protein